MSEREFVVHGSVQCLGSIDVQGEVGTEGDPELYESLATLFGPHLAGWEHGDTIWLAASSRSLEAPPVDEYRLSSAPRVVGGPS